MSVTGVLFKILPGTELGWINKDADYY